jgi:hypothetical protein
MQPLWGCFLGVVILMVMRSEQDLRRFMLESGLDH